MRMAPRAAVAVLCALVATPCLAQGGRAANGPVPPLVPHPVLDLPAARDLNGVWQIERFTPGIRPENGDPLPFTPAGRMAYEKNMAGLKNKTLVDEARHVCVPDGVPRILQSPYPFRIVQTPGQTTILYELNHVFRIVAMDKALPDHDMLTALPFYSGHSVGHWDGDTLVIETAGFNTKTFIDDTGVPHSDALTTVERMRKIDNGKKLEVRVTVTDPKTFTHPWTARFVYDPRPNVRLRTYVCGEKHRDVSNVEGAPQ